MRTRTFIGLVFLIAALLVASTPPLLNATASGVETVGIQTGLMTAPGQTKESKAARKAAEKTVDPALQLRGYAFQENGDFRDTVAVDERAAVGHDRLVAGNSRVALPGQWTEGSDDTPHSMDASGVLLDATGCPVFPTGTDVAALMADTKVQATYGGLVAKADDPVACQAFVEDLMNGKAATPTVTPGVDRQRASITRGSRTAILIGLRQVELLEQLMSDSDMNDKLDEMRGTGGATSSAATTGTAASTTAAGGGTAGAATSSTAKSTK
jgi:hypothetical protein